MPSRKRKQAELRASDRNAKAISDFEMASKTHQFQRKWIPDVVFAATMRRLFHSNITRQQLNLTLQKSISMSLLMS